MMKRSIPFLVLLLACGGREGSRSLEGTYAGQLTLVATYGPTGDAGSPVSWAGNVVIAAQTGDQILGWFSPREGASAGRSATFQGTVLADGTASLTFTVPPVATAEIPTFTSAGGCESTPDGLGPYGGQISRHSVSLRTPDFEVNCCCATRPGPDGGVIVGIRPWYLAQYRLEAAR